MNKQAVFRVWDKVEGKLLPKDMLDTVMVNASGEYFMPPAGGSVAKLDQSRYIVQCASCEKYENDDIVYEGDVVMGMGYTNGELTVSCSHVEMDDRGNFRHTLPQYTYSQPYGECIGNVCESMYIIEGRVAEIRKILPKTTGGMVTEQDHSQYTADLKRLLEEIQRKLRPTFS